MPRSNLRFAMISLVVLLAVGARADAAVTIADPASGNSYSSALTQIAADGQGFPGQVFTVQIWNNNTGLVISSCGVTVDSNGKWACNLPAPTGGWPTGVPCVAECVYKGAVISNQNSISFY